MRENGFISVWDLTARKDLNALWIENGRYTSDVYAFGDISYLSIRQLRAHGFIFVRKTGEKIQTKDGEPPYDVTIKTVPGQGPLTLIDVENQIGAARMRMRKEFGDVLRAYALKRARDHHGCEAETIMQADPRVHHLYGMPPETIHYERWLSHDCTLTEREGTEWKLTAMLDYFIYSADVVIYVGAGDLKSLYEFRRLDRRRFERIRWICVDPISKDPEYGNIRVERRLVHRSRDIADLVNHGAQMEVAFIWDVRTDREDYTAEEWEEATVRQDELGEEIARSYAHIFGYALLKRRIPRESDEVRIYASLVLPQPYAGTDMYEVRSYLKLSGYMWQQRSHIVAASHKVYSCAELRSMVEYANYGGFGRDLKRRHFETLNIVRADGLTHPLTDSRADLFYMTNMCNLMKEQRIGMILGVSKIATVWIGDSTFTGYDDFTYSARVGMLTQSSATRMVLDGLGFMLFLMWKRAVMGRMDVQRVPFDPSWAAKFLVVCERPEHEFVPDVALSRFIGIRRVTSHYRMTAPHIYRKCDEIKSNGLDVSGHLLAALVTGWYGFDLYWWVRMILEWSSLGACDKKKELARSGAHVIEWKEERAAIPWHKREDLIAALQCARAMKLPSVSDEMLTSWIEMLRLS